MNLLELAPIIVKKGLRIRENEVIEVILNGEKNFLDFLDEFTLEISKLGAYPIIRLATPSYRKRYLREVPEKYIRRTPPHVLRWIRDFQRHIKIIADDPDPVFSKISSRKQNAARDARLPINENILRRNLSRIFLPTEPLAKSYNIPSDLFIREVTNSLNVDYSRLRRTCKKIYEKLRINKTRIAIRTGEKSELTLQLGTRTIFTEDGMGNLPAGSVMVAPIENSVNGVIEFPETFVKDRRIINLKLEFQNGKIVDAGADKNFHLFDRRLRDAYGDKNVFARFGIGLNPGLSQLIGLDAVDVNLSGTVSVSIGSNLLYGGNNSSDLFWTFLAASSTVSVNNYVLIDAGKLNI